MGRNKMRGKISAFALTLALGAASAAANPAAFTTLDRTAPGSHISGDVAFSFQNLPVNNFGQQGIDLTSVRLDVRANWVSRRGNLGLFLHLPVSAMFVNDRFTNLDNEFTLANIEAAGVYILRNRDFDLVFRGGFVLPTAGDSQGAQIANLAASYMRLTDLALAAPSTTWFRASASILGGNRRGIFWRADAGVDLAVSTPNNLDIDPLLRLNAGVGYRLRKFAVMGELVNMINANLGNLDDDMAHTLAITARSYHFGVVPSFGIVFPLDSTLRNRGFDFGFTAGIRGRL